MNTADMLIHVHPDLDAHERNDLERELEGCIGVDCAAFDHRPHPHALMVKYDPQTVSGMDLLHRVRRHDPVATMVGL